MGYDIFRFGAIFLNGNAQKIPKQPHWDGDIPEYNRVDSISIRLATGAGTITWIKPNGLNLLIADRTLLVSVSWDDLEKQQFVEGKDISIEDQPFRCRLPKVGAEEGVPNEWDQALNIAGEDNFLWNWDDMFFWGSEAAFLDNTQRIVRGWVRARSWALSEPEHQKKDIGFRPVLEICPSYFPKANCVLEGMKFQLSGIPGSKDFCPILQPDCNDAFTHIPDGQAVRMYTITENGRPIHPDGTFQSKSQLKLTDKYFGNEYLVSWTISNGVAVADKALSFKT